MNCPRCGQPIAEAALFCGNCGLQLPQAVSPIANVLQRSTEQSPATYASFGHMATSGGVFAAPAYAVTSNHVHNHVKIVLALVAGCIGIIGAAFIPILGIGLGITGLVLATTASRASGRGLKIAAIILASIAVLAGLGVWGYVASKNPRLHPGQTQKTVAAAASAHAVTESALSTPCYSFTLPTSLNITNTSGSCQMNAFNGTTLATSSNVYKVLISQDNGVTTTNFNGIAKKALEDDITENLPGFMITGEGSGTFSNSPAYYLTANDISDGVAVEEATVLHSSATGAGVYVLVHITFGTSTNLNTLDKSWQWK
jgi:hypothetical protein